MNTDFFFLVNLTADLCRGALILIDSNAVIMQKIRFYVPLSAVS
jgi:hypothetical protein